MTRVVDPPDQLWSLQSLQIVLETIPHIVWVADADGHTEYFNRKGVAFTGLQSDQTGSWGWLTVVHPDDAERARSKWKHAQHTATSMAVDYRVRRADGEYRWVSSLAEPIVDAAGAVIRWVGTWSDIQAEHELQERLRDTAAAAAESVALVSALESMTPVGFGFVDRDFRVTQINDEIARLHGLVPQAAVGRRVEELVPEDWPRLEPVYRRVLDGGERVSNVEVVKTNVYGDRRQWLFTYYPVRAGDDIAGLGFVGIDITSWRRADMLRAAVTESMVEGLYALDPGGRLTFMNPAASRMLGWSEDELRGDDMHATVHYQHADGTPYSESECPLLKARTEGRPVTVSDDAFTRKDGSILPVAYSASPLVYAGAVDGVVVVFRDITDEKSELQRAHRELTALSWVGRLREALDEGRIVLYSQPIVPLGEGERSEELLVRMIGRDGQVILPGAFLPIAERYGMITEIDQFVIRKAVQLAAGGRRVGVNVSAESITQIDLLGLIEQEMRCAGADPLYFVFELTETALMRDLEAGRRFAIGLADLGCAIALDDFGTGFGGFTYLKRLPVHYLKIDTDFVRDLSNSAENRHVVQAIVTLAQGFGQRTIAEGVEDSTTMVLLREMGVDYAQGFFIGKPAPVDR